MGHSIHNVDISKLLTHTMPCTLSAICPVQWKPGFIREEDAIKCEHLPTQVGYDDELQSGRDLDEDDDLEVCYPTRTRGSRNTFGFRVGFRVNV